MTARPALIDTNILCYALDASEPVKRAACAELLARCWRSEINLSVSVQNLAEFSVVMTEKVRNPVPDAIVTRFIEHIRAFDGFLVLSYDAQIIVDAIAIRKTYSLHFWDALLAATMKENSVEIIYTEDAHFAKIPWITVINPCNHEDYGH